MLRLQTQNFQDRFTHIYPTKWFKTTMKMCLFHLLLPMTPLFCNPLSTQWSLRKIGQVPPTSQSEKRSMGGGVPRLRSRKADKSPSYRYKAFQFTVSSDIICLTEDLLEMADKRDTSTDQMKLWKESRGYQVCGYLYLTVLLCPVWNIWVRGHVRFRIGHFRQYYFLKKTFMQTLLEAKHCYLFAAFLIML